MSSIKTTFKNCAQVTVFLILGLSLLYLVHNDSARQQYTNIIKHSLSNYDKESVINTAIPKMGSHTVPIHNTEMGSHTVPIHNTEMSSHTVPINNTEMGPHTVPIHNTEMSSHTVPINNTEMGSHTVPIHNTEMSSHTVPIHIAEANLTRITTSVSCQDLFAGKLLNVSVPFLSNTHDRYISNMVQTTKNCTEFVARRSYRTKHLSQEEADFPIAYTILMYKDEEQTERLLRAIYMPQNIYCIHVDNKSSAHVHRNMTALAKCFSNVFVAKNPVKVVYGHIGILKTDLVCMQQLIQKSRTWKYLINLTGQEFPLRTNLDIVRALKALNGANSIPGNEGKKVERRWKKSVSGEKKGPPPHNLKVFQGPTHILATRAFVEFVLKDKRVQAHLKWTEDVYAPEEIFFSTIQYNSQLRAPGAYNGPDYTKEKAINESEFTQLFSRHKIWYWYKKWHNVTCHGKVVHAVCIPGLDDLPLIYQSDKLFLNKLYKDYEPLVYDCVEELQAQRTEDQYRHSIGQKVTKDILCNT